MSSILLVITLGFLPPVVWLVFWLREDANPEPAKEIAKVFLAGMCGVLVALVLEKAFCESNLLFLNNIFGYGLRADLCMKHPLAMDVKSIWGGLMYFQVFNIVGFAFIEEVVKVFAAYFVALRSKYFDEPVDALVYLVVAALGFAALENALFLADTLKTGLTASITVSIFRFINAALLHVSAAAMVGAGFAFTYFHKERRIREFAFGLFMATLLHALFNFFIIYNVGFDILGVYSQALVTALVIFGAGIALLLFERAKKVISA